MSCNCLLTLRCRNHQDRHIDSQDLAMVLCHRWCVSLCRCLFVIRPVPLYTPCVWPSYFVFIKIIFENMVCSQNAPCAPLCLSFPLFPPFSFSRFCFSLILLLLLLCVRLYHIYIFVNNVIERTTGFLNINKYVVYDLPPSGTCGTGSSQIKIKSIANSSSIDFISFENYLFVT